MHIKSLQLCQTFWGPHQAPLSMGFSRQESWSGLPFPSPKHTHTHICIYTHIIIYCYIYTYLLLESSLYITSFPLSVLPPCPLAQRLLSALFRPHYPTPSPHPPPSPHDSPLCGSYHVDCWNDNKGFRILHTLNW